MFPHFASCIPLSSSRGLLAPSPALVVVPRPSSFALAGGHVHVDDFLPINPHARLSSSGARPQARATSPRSAERVQLQATPGSNFEASDLRDRSVWTDGRRLADILALGW